MAQRLKCLFADRSVERSTKLRVAALGLCALLCVVLSAAASAIAQPAPAPTLRNVFPSAGRAAAIDGVLGARRE